MCAPGDAWWDRTRHYSLGRWQRTPARSEISRQSKATKCNRQPELRTYLLGCQARAREELENLDRPFLLAENEDILLADLIDGHFPKPVTIDSDGVTRLAVSATHVQDRDHVSA